MTVEPRRLLINCDDLGYHPTFNEAILEILSNGIVRSASIMPAAPHFDDAVQRLAAAGIDRVGVHLTIAGEYTRLPISPVSDPRRVPSLVNGDGRFFRDLVAARDRFVPEQVAEEFRSQIEKAYDAGIRVSHLDGHLFCYEACVGGPRLLEVAHAIADRYALPLRCRSQSRRGALPRTHMFWSRTTLEERLLLYTEFLRSYDAPVAELIIHPGKDLAQMAAFAATGERRLADYLFFRGAAFADVVRSRELRVITWAEV
jgi:chitin disaccharide deacetylase